MKPKLIYFFIPFISIACSFNSNKQEESKTAHSKSKASHLNEINFDTSIKTIHVFVALCDNKYQGIVPVPAAVGNGQDPDNNLYWGCAAGVRSYFRKSANWAFVKKEKLNGQRLERVIFKHKKQNYYLVADAYDGQFIKQCTIDFLESAAGIRKDTIQINGHILGISGNSKLLSYIGHDGLMDFNLTQSFPKSDNNKRELIILACISKRYFASHVKETGAHPLVWSTGLMSPEAYTLHDALESYIGKQSDEAVRSSAAKAYARYQKCGEKAARNLLVTGY